MDDFIAFLIVTFFFSLFGVICYICVLSIKNSKKSNTDDENREKSIFSTKIRSMFNNSTKIRSVFTNQDEIKESSEENPINAYCPNCGAKIPEGAKFCPSCGTTTKSEVFEDKIRCPKCGCSDIGFATYQSSSNFDRNDACCGYLLCGPIGLLFGAKDKTEPKTVRKCKKCGHEW